MSMALGVYLLHLELLPVAGPRPLRCRQRRDLLPTNQELPPRDALLLGSSAADQRLRGGLVGDARALLGCHARRTARRACSPLYALLMHLPRCRATEHAGSAEGTGGSRRIVKQTGFEGRRVTWAVPRHGADLAHITSGPGRGAPRSAAAPHGHARPTARDLRRFSPRLSFGLPRRMQPAQITALRIFLAEPLGLKNAYLVASRVSPEDLVGAHSARYKNHASVQRNG